MTIEIKGRQAMILTRRGTYAKRCDCLTHPDTAEYLEKNIDAFYVEVSEGKYKWNRRDNGKIAYNVEEKRWELISRLSVSGLLRGFYDVEIEQGYFRNNENVVYLKEYFSGGTPIPCINSEIALKLGYLSSLWDEYYYNPRNLSGEEKKALKQPKIVKYSKALEFNYNANEGNSAFRNIQQAYSQVDYKIEPRTWDISKLLNGKTFGKCKNC